MPAQSYASNPDFLGNLEGFIGQNMTRLDDDIPYQDILQYISDNKLKGTTSNRTLWEAVHANHSTSNRTLWEAVHANHSITILMSGAPSLHFQILVLLYTEISFKSQVFTLYVILAQCAIC